MASIAAMEFNTVEALFALALVNGIGITDEFNNGDIIIMPDYIKQPSILMNVKKEVVTNGFTTTAKALQTLLDIDMQSSKSINNIFDLAIINGMSITNNLTPGQGVMLQTKVLDVFLLSVPASGIPSFQDQTGGIGYMQITTSFKVS